MTRFGLLSLFWELLPQGRQLALHCRGLLGLLRFERLQVLAAALEPHLQRRHPRRQYLQVFAQRSDVHGGIPALAACLFQRAWPPSPRSSHVSPAASRTDRAHTPRGRIAHRPSWRHRHWRAPPVLVVPAPRAGWLPAPAPTSRGGHSTPPRSALRPMADGQRRSGGARSRGGRARS